MQPQSAVSRLLVQIAVICAVLLAFASPVFAACGDYEDSVIPADAAIPEAPDDLEIIGGHCIPVAFSYETVGEPPDGAGARVEWANAAAAKIVDMYVEEGFTAARVWWVEDDDGTLRIGIDEGLVHRVNFDGANSIEKLTFADNIILMDGVLYAPSVESSLADLQTTMGLQRATYRIRDGDEFVPNPLGMVVPELVMVVQLVDEESHGFGFGIGVESPWGPLVSGKYGARGVFHDRDRLGSKLEIAFPIHEYAFEEEPQFRWIYGKASLDYKFASVGSGPVSPLISMRSSMSRFQRRDLDIESVHVNQNGAQLAAQIQASKAFTQLLGVRLENANLVDVDMYPRADGPLDEDLSASRLAVVTESGFEFEDGTLRSDLRDWVSLTGVLAMNPELEPLLRTVLEAQWVIAVGHNDLLLRGRSIFYTGDVRFYHEEQLAGSYQKVFFTHRYWVDKAAQAEVAFRLRIRRNVKFGVWHDLSFFEDLTRQTTPFAFANGGGLGIHLLLLDQFAFNLFYGGGFAPVGFSHNMVINLRMVY